jgi:hypothetical protein
MKTFNLATRYLLLTTIYCALCINLKAQTSVTPFDAANDYLNGITYSLPKNQVNITITARCTIEKPGPFYQYAERYLATKDIITTNTETWEIENIDIHTSAIADPNRTFQVAIDTRGVANNITYTHDNIIAGINIESDMPNMSDKSEKFDKYDKSQFSILNSQFNYSVLNEDALVATSIPKMAEMVARQIYHIRESRTALLSADLDQMPDGDALKTMLAQRDTEEKELLASFVGKTTSYTVTKTYSITPDDDLKDHVIARISSSEGLIEANNVIGKPIYLNVKGTYYNAPLTDPKLEKAPKGFHYNVPGKAKITVESPNFTTQTTLPIAQFGYTTPLNASLTNNKTTRIIFNPELGTILKIEK